MEPKTLKDIHPEMFKRKLDPLIVWIALFSILLGIGIAINY